jgi:CheY-like chemotaxis protein
LISANAGAAVKNILILEDELVLSVLFRLVLKGHFTVETTTAEEALLQFRRHDRQFDLLISDVRLKKSSGVQVALILRAELPDLPIILTSGYPVRMWGEQETAGLHRLGIGSVTVLSKPFSIEVILNAVDALIGPPDVPEPVERRRLTAAD